MGCFGDRWTEDRVQVRHLVGIAMEWVYNGRFIDANSFPIFPSRHTADEILQSTFSSMLVTRMVGQ